MIGKRYLEGITADTLQAVYDYVIGTGLVSFTLESFINAQVTDTDIKKDFTNTEGLSILSRLLEQAIPRKEGRAATVFKQKYNQGIQWNDRRTDKFMTQPYLKIYNKWADFESNSVTFADAFGISVDSHYWRVETTIKNRQHWKAHKVTDTTLQNIINLDQSKQSDIMTTALKAHLEPTTRIRAKADNERLSPQDTITANTIYFLTELGQTFGAIERTLLQGLDRVNKSKHKTKLKAIYDEQVKPTPEGKKMDRLNKVFESIGYNF